MPTPPNQVGQTLLTGWISRLRFPQLFVFTAVLFVVDSLVPDLVPFMDEILLAAATLLLANIKSKPKATEQEKPPLKDITPPDESTGSQL